MVKSLVVLAAVAAILSTAGCCWPLHEGRYGHYDRWSEYQRPPPPSRPYRGYDNR
jgi:hypothetical protein